MLLGSANFPALMDKLAVSKTTAQLSWWNALSNANKPLSQS
jgi:hypothetical protein